MPLLIGNATKVSKYLINHDKEYEAVLKLGIKTSTADIEGKVIERVEVDRKILDEKFVNNTLKSFIGKQTQVPPIYSAIKVNGKKLYDYARNGENVEIQSRQIEIYDIVLNNINLNENEITFSVKCSKGTYIRTLCEDVAKRLGSIGYMKELNRLSVGNFKIEDSITISELEKQISMNDFSSIISIEDLFKNKTSIELEKMDLSKFLNGVKIDVNNDCNDVCKVYIKNKFIGLGIIENGQVKRDIIVI